jgi:diguanylate cyclase
VLGQEILGRQPPAGGQASKRVLDVSGFGQDPGRRGPSRGPERLHELRQAIEQDELTLHFQPKVDLTGGLAGVEALVRWRHPQRGVVPPDQFIPLAEHTGLIKPLTRWVLEAALRQCRAWLAGGREIPVAVNVSMHDLHDTGFPNTIAGLLASNGVPARCLRVEITECAIMADPARAQEVLERLRALGIGVAVDDFGTGYSSLAYLKRLPVDELKIDRSFVRHLAEDDNDRAIVRSTIGLAHDLGLNVVAEGVEDQAAWDLLGRFGCDLVQGYFVSRPLPAAELVHWLEASPWGHNARPLAA